MPQGAGPGARYGGAMGHILVLYATVDGQTGRIAQHMALTLRHQGHDVTIRTACVPHAGDDASLFDGVIVGAGIRYGNYPKYVAPLVRDCVRPLETPTAFYSVCLSAGGPGARPGTARKYVDTFLRKTRWKPGQAESFGGALLYRRYNVFIRFMMRLIVGMAGGDTDTSRDYEYTDWAAVTRFANAFGETLGEPVVLARAHG
jgi:menaquinone-dependent protoporphyrinogen oxidase